jgi:hypothetical protein
MPIAPYTTPAAIATYLGRTFTPEQDSWATSVAAGITVWIDHRTGRTWQLPADITDEPQTTAGQTVYLDQRPVTAVTSVSLRGMGASGEWAVVDPADYELTDPRNGVLVIATASNNQDARVSYSYAAAGPPADIAMAATVLSADYLATALAPESFGLETVAVGQNDLSLHYAGASGKASASAMAALGVVDSYRKVVFA